MNLIKMISLATVLLFASFSAHADFGEIDILVQESVQSHFSEYGQSVELQKMTYIGKPVFTENRMTLRTSVWAEQRQIKPYWGWYECTTTIEVKNPGQYFDLGTNCYFDAE